MYSSYKPQDKRSVPGGLSALAPLFQLRDQRLHNFRRDRPGFDAARPADVDADHPAAQVHQRTAAIARLQDRVVLENDRVAIAAIAQLAAESILKLGAEVAALLPALQRHLQFVVLVAAANSECDDFAGPIPGEPLLKLLGIVAALTVETEDNVVGPDTGLQGRGVLCDAKHDDPLRRLLDVHAE